MAKRDAVARAEHRSLCGPRPDLDCHSAPLHDLVVERVEVRVRRVPGVAR